jgi:transcriptional regulator PpsR
VERTVIFLCGMAPIMKAFRAPKTTLGDLDAAKAAELIASATDVAVILDEAGVIRDVSINADDLMRDFRDGTGWIGKHWVDTVSRESRGKAEELIAGAFSGQGSRWRHLNHPVETGPDVPILYAAVQASMPGRIIAFGRGLRAVSTLQRRLVDAQQSMERDYARIRNMETRYRLLFEMASDMVLVIETNNQRIVDSNPVARRMLGDRRGPFRVEEIFSEDTAQGVALLLAGVMASGRSDDVGAKLRDGDQQVTVSASLFRDESGTACLLRIAGAATDHAAATSTKLKGKLLKLMESAPDGFAVTSADGRVITANSAFLQIAQLPNEERARGETIDKWLGRGEVDLDILTGALRQHGSVRLYGTTFRGDLGEESEVEISAASVMNGGRPCFGFAIRDVSRRLPDDTRRDRRLPTSFDHLSDLIGRVALKDLVREATDVIERLCIEAALEMTGDNRASAAEILGLSRQSLYIKLRRYGIGDLPSEGAV